MPEQPVIMRPSAVPHHGLVSPGCPVDCLRTVLSWHSFNPLACANGAPFGPPHTVGEVIGLYGAGRLHEIHGLGRRRISEIGAGLVLAGLVVSAEPPRTEGIREPESGKAAE